MPLADVPPAPLLSYAAVILTAGVAAGVNSMAGGGTFLTFPALTGLARLSEKVANMTSTVGIWPGTASGVYAAKEDFKHIPRRMIITFGIISLLGGCVGALLLIFTSVETFKLVIPWLLAFATGVFSLSKPISRWAASHGAHAGHTSAKWTFFVGIIQFFIAIYGGYFGAGASVLILAGLSFAGLESLHHMNALKIFLNSVVNAIAVVIFITISALGSSPDRIHWPLAAGMAVSAAIGGYVGMRIARKMKADKLRLLILAVGVILTAIYFYKGYFAPT